MDLTTIGIATKNDNTNSVTISNNNNNNGNNNSSNNNQNDKNRKGFTKFWTRWKNRVSSSSSTSSPSLNDGQKSKNTNNGCTCFEYFSNANLFILCCIAACFSLVGFYCNILLIIVIIFNFNIFNLSA